MIGGPEAIRDDSQTVTFPHPLVHELRAGAETLAKYAAARPLDELAGLLNGAASLMDDAAEELSVVPDLVKAAGSVLWVASNLRYYGTDSFRRYLVAAIEDARRAYSAATGEQR